MNPKSFLVRLSVLMRDHRKRAQFTQSNFLVTFWKISVSSTARDKGDFGQEYFLYVELQRVLYKAYTLISHN